MRGRTLARLSPGLALAAGLCGLAAFAPAFDGKLPAGVAPPPVPVDNPMSEAKVALGRRLFYDADLSIDGTMACATCHEQRRAFTDDAAGGAADKAFHRIDLPFSGDQGLGEITGADADRARFRTPGLRNVALTAPYLHDGSARTVVQAIRRHRTAATLENAQLADLAAFLDTLTDRRFVNDNRFSPPRQGCG